MKRTYLENAQELATDIDNIKKVLLDHKVHRWIKVIFRKGLSVVCPHEDLYYSVRFQKELAEWLKQKKEQYEKELDAL
jgi:hypothetical protein